MTTIAVLDYGMGNVHSVSKALEHVAPKSRIVLTNDYQTINQADRVVFPGVGAIRDCIGNLTSYGLDDCIRHIAHAKPMLAICVGMQALLDNSEESNGVDCLGILPGSVRFFGTTMTDTTGEILKVPHMGWNQVSITNHPMWRGIENQSEFYFVHSYYADVTQQKLIYGETSHGITFPSVLGDDNIFAVQFHPEKSQRAGLTLLRNFIEWNGES